MDSPPEDRTRTIRMCKSLGIWPLDRRHRQNPHCCCERCFGDVEVGFANREATISPDQLAHLRAKKRRVALPWEEDAAA